MDKKKKKTMELFSFNLNLEAFLYQVIQNWESYGSSSSGESTLRASLDALVGHGGRAALPACFIGKSKHRTSRSAMKGFRFETECAS